MGLHFANKPIIVSKLPNIKSVKDNTIVGLKAVQGYDFYMVIKGSYVRMGGTGSTLVGAVDWGEIGGVLSSQTDLQGALNGKASSSHGHSNATQSVSGFMSATDKTKLDGLSSANSYFPSGW